MLTDLHGSHRTLETHSKISIKRRLRRLIDIFFSRASSLCTASTVVAMPMSTGTREDHHLWHLIWPVADIQKMTRGVNRPEDGRIRFSSIAIMICKVFNPEEREVEVLIEADSTVDRPGLSDRLAVPAANRSPRQLTIVFRRCSMRSDGRMANTVQITVLAAATTI
eukprot:SAG31_NODE_2831_length_5026_cov_4.017049_4_plen_166_part_00